MERGKKDSLTCVTCFENYSVVSPPLLFDNDLPLHTCVVDVLGFTGSTIEVRTRAALGAVVLSLVYICPVSPRVIFFEGEVGM